MPNSLNSSKQRSKFGVSLKPAVAPGFRVRACAACMHAVVFVEIQDRN